MNLASIMVLCIVLGLLIISIIVSRKEKIGKCNGNCLECGHQCYNK